MKPISQLLARSALVCLSLIPAALAGPGGTYSPTVPRGYAPNNSSYDGGGFGGGFSHRGHDHYEPGVIVGPNRTYGPNRPVGKFVDSDRHDDHDHPHFDRINDRDRDRRPVVVVQPNRSVRDRVILVHRPNYYKDGWYHGDWHSNWSKSLKGRPYAWSGWGGNWKGWDGKVTGTVASSPWRFGYWSYSNPYYTQTANAPAYFNYSQPIIAANITADASGQFYPQTSGQGTREHALEHFADARRAFFRGDLRRAQSEIDDAIATLPSDTVLHEFRSLVLFARGDYNAAAGGIYAVLSSGPGWDWTTMIGLYPNANIYTAQLRGLEEFCNSNPRAVHPRFLLGYHYLTAGYTDAAAEMYRQVVSINPRDSLSAQLMASLTGTGYGQVAELPQFDPQSISNQYLVGNWSATREDGSTFQLQLRRDGVFTWVYGQGGLRQQLSGAYTLNDGALILQQDGQPAMVGQIYQMGPNRFVFKLIGADQYDPGLTFYR